MVQIGLVAWVAGPDWYPGEYCDGNKLRRYDLDGLGLVDGC